MNSELKNTIWERVLEVADKSPCQKRKVGCIIVNATGELVSLGYNYNTKFGLEHCEDDDDFTYDTVIHAEDMACQQVPDHMKGEELYAYISHEPCKACNQILNTICKEIFWKDLSPKWPNRNSVEETMEEMKDMSYGEQMEHIGIVEEVLQERGNSHGDFALSSEFVQNTKRWAHKAPNWTTMNDAEREAVHMIIHKLGRWLYGKSIDDHMIDICGYATLAKDNK